MRNFLIYICESVRTKRYQYVINKMIETGEPQQISKQLFLFTTKEEVRNANDIIQYLTGDFYADIFIVEELNKKSMYWCFKNKQKSQNVIQYFENLPKENKSRRCKS